MKIRKTIIRKSILTAVMLTALFSNATNVDINLKKELNKTTVTLNDVKPGNQLIIKDLNGVILYKEQIKSSGTYSKGFDLTALPNGSYFFELEKDLQIESFPFTVYSEKVTFNEKEKAVIHKPFVTSKGNYVYISKLALNRESLDIKIYYQEKSELIYSEKIKDTKDIQKAYKLATDAKGEYKIVLTSNGREYYKYITL